MGEEYVDMKKMPQNINLSLVPYVVKGRNFLNRIIIIIIIIIILVYFPYVYIKSIIKANQDHTNFKENRWQYKSK